MAKILLESGGIMWKNAIYLFSSILIASLVILISGRYLDGISGSYLENKNNGSKFRQSIKLSLKKSRQGMCMKSL